MAFKIGAIIADRYRVTARIGHGGMSEVYEATDIIYRKTVAVKLIREDVMKNPINLKRFQNEVTIAASLSHPNIIAVLDHGIVDGRPYIINEYISGQTLKEKLDFRGRLPINEAVEVMLQLTSVLYYAHEHNIIHRDIKPENIFMLSDGTIKLGDFGIAESFNLQDVNNPSEIVGSVHYLAPEISVGKPATRQSDIYSAGVTFFELITGHVPFTSTDAVSVAVAHIKEKFPSPRKYIPDCPKEIEKIIFKATAKNPNNRYENFFQFNNELKELEGKGELKEKKGFFAKIFGFK